MDKLETEKLELYRSIIKKILDEYYQTTVTQSHKSIQNSSKPTETSDAPKEPSADERIAFDDEHNQYLWFRFGWEEKQRIQHIIMYLCIKNGKIWVEEDATDLCVVDDLLAAGIPQTDIVLGFHHPRKRDLTEFAML
jgi:XisI protein